MLDEAIQKEIIQKGRDFLKSPLERDPYEEAFESDQDRKLPQPPLVKAPMAEESGRVALTRDFSGLALKNDLVSLIRDRRSARIYTGETMTPDELSFLLWATQGVKNEFGQFMYFRNLTCVPIDLDAIDVNALTATERRWLNEYHAAVYETIAPYLTEDERAWLRDATRAI